MNSNTIIEVLNKLIGETEPVADSAVDKNRLANLETLIDIISELISRICEVNRSDLAMYGSADECITRAHTALESIAENIQDELGYGNKPANKVTLNHKSEIEKESVTDVFLLSREEWGKAKETNGVPEYAYYSWWLRIPGCCKECAAVVANDGWVDLDGVVVANDKGVRPALRIPTLSQMGYKPGDKVTINNTVCTVIDKDVVLTDNIVCSYRFDFQNNNWERSDIKGFLNSPRFLSML